MWVVVVAADMMVSFALEVVCAGWRGVAEDGLGGAGKPCEPGVKLEADFRPRRGASLLGPKMPLEPHGRRRGANVPYTAQPIHSYHANRLP